MKKKAIKLTKKWAKRCKIARNNSSIIEKQALFGILQGGCELDLREQSLDQFVNIGFDGYGIGG